MSGSTSVGAAGGSGGGGGSGGIGGIGGSGTVGGGGPCGACKFLRRKCVSGCIFAPHFNTEHGAAHFAAVHKVFGASNVSKLLLQIPAAKRVDAVVTICYEAQARIRDPVYGCVSHVFSLQQQVANLQAELTCLQAHLATLELPAPPPFPQQPQMPMATAAPFSISDLPLTLPSNIPSSIDVSSLFDPSMMQSSSQWAFQQQPQQQQLQQQQPFVPMMGDGSGGFGGGNIFGDGDLQALARELLERQSAGAMPQQPPHTNC